ncbi:hypothetical protein ANANG_G00161790 [Anguilla anguilla]|uniref:Serine/arginine repetitive matrix protein C-terminal domain-containing protein n=1 Tax=Anguilla anguilla TaxID=7936 RepID=A0A9D3M8F3_ANGAN|nr:hypothetical protein ANANG_G00161790 [Anguilla anguilla]
MRSSAGLAGARASLSPHPKGAKAQDASGTSPGSLRGSPRPGTTIARARSGPRRPVKRRSRQRAPGRSSHSPARSSDSAHSQHDLPVNKRNKSSQQKKTRGARSSKRRHRNRTQARHRSSSASRRGAGAERPAGRRAPPTASASAAAPGAARPPAHAHARGTTAARPSPPTPARTNPGRKTAPTTRTPRAEPGGARGVTPHPEEEARLPQLHGGAEDHKRP